MPVDGTSGEERIRRALAFTAGEGRICRRPRLSNGVEMEGVGAAGVLDGDEMRAAGGDPDLPHAGPVRAESAVELEIGRRIAEDVARAVDGLDVQREGRV